MPEQEQEKEHELSVQRYPPELLVCAFPEQDLDCQNDVNEANHDHGYLDIEQS